MVVVTVTMVAVAAAGLAAVAVTAANRAAVAATALLLVTIVGAAGPVVDPEDGDVHTHTATPSHGGHTDAVFFLSIQEYNLPFTQLFAIRPRAVLVSVCGGQLAQMLGVDRPMGGVVDGSLT